MSARRALCEVAVDHDPWTCSACYAADAKHIDLEREEFSARCVASETLTDACNEEIDPWDHVAIVFAGSHELIMAHANGSGIIKRWHLAEGETWHDLIHRAADDLSLLD